MTSLRAWFDHFTATTGEPVMSVVFGADAEYLDADDEDRWNIEPAGEVIPVKTVPAAILDREFDDGYGGNNSPDLCAWSKSWVLFSDNYDGAEQLCWVPRHPVAHHPTRPGGG